MDDLLKEAIADAKAVRETALANAKMALEEAFTPRLKSMLASKIANEVEGEEPEMEDAEETYEEDDEVPVEPEAEMAPEEDEEVPVEPEAEEAPEEMMDAEEGEEEMEEEGVIEIDGVKYAPVVSEEEDEEEEAPVEEEEAADEDELDLEAILRELEDADEDEEEPVAEGEEEDEVEESVTEGEEEEDEVDESKEVKEEKDEDEMDEDIDLEEVLKALSEEEVVEEEVEEVAKLQTELKEHRDVVKFLRAKLNEVNLLNAKLLFSNKLFRSFGLTNEQKMKVVETFDRTKNLREIKLVYSTLAESFGQVKKPTIKESVKKGSSSKAVASTKPKKKVISEGDDLKARFKKLANII